MNRFHILDPTVQGQNASRFCALAIMTKAPQAGQVKTRLVPPLKPDEAAELNRFFLHDTTTTIANFATPKDAISGYYRNAATGLGNVFILLRWIYSSAGLNRCA